MHLLRLFVPQLLALWSAAPQTSDAHPALHRLLARARLAQTPGAHFDRALFELFGVERQDDWPAAAFSWLADGGTRDARYRLRADPVFLRADRDALVLLDSEHFALSASEAEQLVAALNRHFAADGLHFDALHPTRWYLTAERAPQLTTVPLHEAVAQSVDPNLPRGADAFAWHRYFNEVQMLLHTLPVNTMREEAGQPMINSVWIWGGGRLPDKIAAQPSAVFADDPVSRGLAIAAAIPQHHAPRDLTAVLAAAPGDAPLVLLDRTAGDLDQLERAWFAPLLEALKADRVERVEIVSERAERTCSFAITRADLWRFWRRAPALSAA